MDMTTVNALIVQIGIPLITGLVGIGLAWSKKRLNLQETSTAATLENIANNAIQQATQNFAGRVASGIVSGTLTPATAVSQLQTYLGATVADSVKLVQPNATALTTMLLGKVATIAGVENPIPAGPLPVPVSGPVVALRDAG